MKNAQFTKRIDSGGIELELIRRAEETRKETRNRERAAVREYALSRGAIPLLSNQALAH